MRRDVPKAVDTMPFPAYLHEAMGSTCVLCNHDRRDCDCHSRFDRHFYAVRTFGDHLGPDDKGWALRQPECSVGLGNVPEHCH